MLSTLFRRAAGPVGGEPLNQVGAIPYRIVDGHIVFLLVTSRRTGRWIYPKGAVIDGMTPPESAACEALEEAGVEGRIWPEPIGSYDSVKIKGMTSTPLRVSVYPLEVTQQHDTWKEKGQRHRHWALLAEARRLLSEPRLMEITRDLHANLRDRGAGDHGKGATLAGKASEFAQKSAKALINK
ncbi:MAG: NUDIX hydrolase [Salinarimonas sp.]|nr:NUDIX hydrolase [Salinarimonas sp.]